MRLFSAALLAAAFAAPAAHPCTRILHETGQDDFLVGRSMDWSEDTRTDLWVFPRGMARDGGTSENPEQWTSRYGSVVASIYDIASVDGMNEAGLVANALYLAEADYGTEARAGQPGMLIGAWLQYVLDNFSTVEEAVAAMEADDLRVVAPRLPNGKAATGHVSISDPGGDSAIFEYADGKLVIHHSPDYRVMTNSPTYDRQLAIMGYWSEIGGFTMLPGTNRAADRFARAAFYNSAVPTFEDHQTAVAAVLSMVRAVSVPYGLADPERPDLSSTQWRVLADKTNRRYFFDSALSPSLFWVDTDRLDFAEDAPVMKLKLNEGAILAGESSAAFVEAAPFDWAAAGSE